MNSADFTDLMQQANVDMMTAQNEPAFTMSDVDAILRNEDDSSQQSLYRPQPTTDAAANMPKEVRDVWVQIVEQPRQRGMRFRYECEGRSAGSIPGENSTNEQRTFPAIKINNYKGPAVIVVSVVDKGSPPKPHPHALVGKDCTKGVCTVKIRSTGQPIQFPNLGIQCAKKKDVSEALKQREQIRVDPFQTGFKHMKSSNIDLTVVKLCFQVFLPDENGKFTKIVPPVVSQPIFDKKALNDLVICRLSRHAGNVRGNDEVFLLCDKVQKEDIQVRFYKESDNGDLEWEGFGDFGQSDVHRQVAIVFKTPAFRDTQIGTPVSCFLQLRRPSDGEVSDPKPFQFMPDDTDLAFIDRKRKRKVLNMTGMDISGQAPVVYSGPPDPAQNPLTQRQIINDRLRKKATRNQPQQQFKSEAPPPQSCMYQQTGLPAQANTATFNYSNTAMGSVTMAPNTVQDLNAIHYPPAHMSTAAAGAPVDLMSTGGGQQSGGQMKTGFEPMQLSSSDFKLNSSEMRLDSDFKLDSGNIRSLMQMNSGELAQYLADPNLSTTQAQGVATEAQPYYDPSVAANEQVVSDDSQLILNTADAIIGLNAS
ncbi:putative transcription factor p65 homolog [Lingula anatina]|uniref:Transcription factor p65 homolog n=1 Tax=Lingula anatina TaxID=7574 RepID=A0A1S3I090_LINAN|nr:putative transcription factor p65 homolog [Lingula anatina]XP_013391680.1 putative transcription factor p65 homolog [Lingula anatina]|eukprot:XP_013391679.1 putative transcription factor p65 homolog [Lingula anatina]